MPFANPPNRYHYIPSPELPNDHPRHWLLDWPPGRALLKAHLRDLAPEARVPVFGSGRAYDFELDLLIDALSLRDLPPPDNAYERLKLDAHFFLDMVMVGLGGSHLRVRATPQDKASPTESNGSAEVHHE